MLGCAPRNRNFLSLSRRLLCPPAHTLNTLILRVHPLPLAYIGHDAPTVVRHDMKPLQTVHPLHVVACAGIVS